MREKFTITPEDQKYMDSIGKSLHKQPKLISKAQARTSALKAKIGGGGKGRSYISGKTYRHE